MRKISANMSEAPRSSSCREGRALETWCVWRQLKLVRHEENDRARFIYVTLIAPLDVTEPIPGSVTVRLNVPLDAFPPAVAVTFNVVELTNVTVTPENPPPENETVATLVTHG